MSSPSVTASESGDAAPDAGVVYLAFGAAYQREARRSILSLRRSNPQLRVAVVTDATWTEDPRPDRFVLREPIRSLGCKPELLYDASPFEKNLYLDTDTVVARDIVPVFGLLDFFDLAVCFEGPRLDGPPGLEFHSQCNTGVILFRKSPIVAGMFAAWRDEYGRQVAANTGTATTKGLNDQRSFATAMAMSRVRVTHLPEFLNFVLWHVSKAYNPPAIFHGRLRGMEALDTEISGRWTDPVDDARVRVWLPHIEGLLPGGGVGTRDPLLRLALTLRRWMNRVRRRFSSWRRMP